MKACARPSSVYDKGTMYRRQDESVPITDTFSSTVSILFDTCFWWNKFVLVQSSSYSPELALCDFFLLSNLKIHLKDKICVCEEH